jgi:hypothetical protein
MHLVDSENDGRCKRMFVPMKLWPFTKAKKATPLKNAIFTDFGIQAPSLKNDRSGLDADLGNASTDAVLDSSTLASSTVQVYAEPPLPTADLYEDDPFLTVEEKLDDVLVDWSSLGPDCVMEPVNTTESIPYADATANNGTITPDNTVYDSIDIDAFSRLSSSGLFAAEPDAPLDIPGDTPYAEALASDALDTLYNQADAQEAYGALTQESSPLGHDLSTGEDPTAPSSAFEPFGDATPHYWENQPEHNLDTSFTLTTDTPGQLFSETAYSESGSVEAEASPEAQALGDQPYLMDELPTDTAPWSVYGQADLQTVGDLGADSEGALASVAWVEQAAHVEASHLVNGTNTTPIAEECAAEAQTAPENQVTEELSTEELSKVYSDNAASYTFDPYDLSSYSAERYGESVSPPVTTAAWQPDELGIDMVPTHGLYEHLVKLHADSLREQTQQTTNRLNNLVSRYFATAV